VGELDLAPESPGLNVAGDSRAVGYGMAR
jgi:hypothetical protein